MTLWEKEIYIQDANLTGDEESLLKQGINIDV
jgi:hypothetical protein